MQKVYAFDFDGTLTTRDTLFAFIRHAKGTAALVWGLLVHVPMLVAMKMGLYNNGKAKERLLGWFFKGTAEQEFEAMCQHFAADSAHLLRPAAVDAISEAVSEGCRVVVVSASIDRWVCPFFSNMPQVEVTGTQMEVRNGKLTGRFLGENCYGPQKVEKLRALLGDRSHYHLTAFGDSRGDRELLAYADEQHFKPFRS